MHRNEKKKSSGPGSARFPVLFAIALAVPVGSSPREILAGDPEPALSTGAPAEPVDRPLQLAITTSGGVAQGAYQAGYLFYLTETAKRNPGLLKLRVLSGASAGMINNMLTVMALGDGSLDAPGDSLFFKVWAEIKYDELFDTDKAPPMALSSRAVLKTISRRLEKVWRMGLSEEVDLVVGAMASRLENRMVRVTDALSVPRQEEKFIFRIQGRGRGRDPAISNFVDRLHGTAQPLLPFVAPAEKSGATEARNFAAIEQILFASSSIPIMFLPQVIDYCMTEPNRADGQPGRSSGACAAPTHRDLFIDGSLADKRPIRLARRIVASGMEENGQGEPVWRDMPDLTRSALPEDVYFLYIDPVRRTYPDKPNVETDEKTIQQVERLFPSMGGFVRNFFTSAQANELSEIVDDYPEIREKLELVVHDFPTISGQLLNFFGFFDREFRRFDFYLGMRDAHRYLEERLAPKIRARSPGKPVEIAFPEPRASSAGELSGAGSWRPYFCLLAETNQEAGLRHACKGPELRDFRILLQTTLDRLYDHCSRLTYDSTVDNYHCKRAMLGNPPPGVFKAADEDHQWKRDRAGGETEVEHTMRLLEDYRFRFRDLGLDPDDADLGMSRIRAELLSYVDAFGEKLPFGERLALHLLGKPAVNFFAYAPPETIMYFMAGTGAEFAVSATMGRSYWLRYNFALFMQGIDTLITERPNLLSFTPMFGLEAEIYPLSSPLFQTRLGLRVGYQFSTGDLFLSKTCNEDDFKESSTACSAPLLQAFLAVSFYERVRLQVGFEWFPEWLPPMEGIGRHLWNGLILVGWQWISPF